MEFLKNSLLFVISLIIGLLIAEGFFAVAGRYNDLVSGGLQASNSTIWTRPLSIQQQHTHPDLNYTVDISFDAFGVRNHSGVRITEFKRPVGLFGDSFTENRRIEDAYAISSQLNKIWNGNYVINFGVDGFGLDQSLQRYLDYRPIIRFSDVVYIFCSNDLRNLYEVDLFEVEKQKGGIILKNKFSQGGELKLAHQLRRWIGKFRVTYFVIESLQKWAQAKEKADGRMFEAVKGFNERYHNKYADGMVQEMLSGTPSLETRAWADKFSLLLNSWKKQVEEDGGRFHVAVLPSEPDMKLLEFILRDGFSSYSVVQLQPPDHFRELKGFSPFFVRDGHWNEMGNLAGALTLADYFCRYGYPCNSEGSSFSKDEVASIVQLYKDHGGSPPTQSSGAPQIR